MIPFCEKQAIYNYLDYTMSLENRQRAAGKCGLPFPNQSPAKMRFILLNLTINIPEDQNFYKINVSKNVEQ